MNQSKEAEATTIKTQSGFSVLSTLQASGVSIEWHELWHEVEVWYGDIQKKESAEQFIERLQNKYCLTAASSELKEENERLREVLEKIAKWEMPETGKYWDDDSERPMSYAACYGSNGERDYIISIATQALKGE